MKYNVIQIFREPIKLILSFILIISSSIFFITQVSIYINSSQKIESIYSKHNMVGTVSVKEDANLSSFIMPISGSYESAIFQGKELDKIEESGYVEFVDPRKVLIAHIDNVNILDEMDVAQGFTSFIGVIKVEEENEYMQEETSIKVKTLTVQEIWYSDELKEGDIIYMHNKISLSDQLSYDEHIDFQKLIPGNTYLVDLKKFEEKYYLEIFAGIYNINNLEELFPDLNNARKEGNTSQNLSGYFLKVNSAELRIRKNAFQVMFTKSLMSIPDFQSRKVFIVEGREFSQLEYQEGERVCIISRKLALENGVEVGDTIKLQLSDMIDTSGGLYQTLQYVPLKKFVAISLSTGEEIYDYNILSEKEDYKVIGFYEREQFHVYDPYYFDDNTLFLPNNCWKTIHENDFNKRYDELHTMHAYRKNAYSFQLTSPKDRDKFIEEMEKKYFDFTNLQIEFLDGGLGAISDSLESIKLSALYLMILSGIIILILLYLYVFFFTQYRRREIIINLLLGMKKQQIYRVYSNTIILFGTVCIIIGYISSVKVIPSLITRIYNNEFDKISSSLYKAEERMIYDTTNLEHIEYEEVQELLHQGHVMMYGEQSSKEEVFWINSEIGVFTVPTGMVLLIVLVEILYIILTSRIQTFHILKVNLLNQMNDNRE